MFKIFTLTIILVFEVTARAKLSKSNVHSAAEALSVAPLVGGLKGTYLTTPPASWMLRMYLAIELRKADTDVSSED